MIIQSIPYPAGGGGGGYGLHRYWRIAISTNNGHSTDTGVAGLEFHSTIGGANITGSGTALSGGSGSDLVGNGPSNAFDGNASTNWARSSTTSTWLGYDFGVGVDIAEIKINPSASDFWSKAPVNFTLDWSDDGSSWTTADTFIGSGWVPNAPQTFPYTLAPGESRMWRVYIPTLNSGSLTYCDDLELRATVGGADQCPVMTTRWDSTGRPFQSSQNGGNEGWQAFNAGTADSAGWLGNGPPQYLGICLPNPITVAQISYKGWAENFRWNPSEIRLQYSNDNGASWTTVQTWTGLTWSTAYETKILTV